jgi:hypothetical protein
MNIFLVNRKCKCGVNVLCEYGDGTKDGDLIPHNGCEFLE